MTHKAGAENDDWRRNSEKESDCTKVGVILSLLIVSLYRAFCYDRVVYMIILLYSRRNIEYNI